MQWLKKLWDAMSNCPSRNSWNFWQKKRGIHETEITSRTLQSGIPANSIRVRNYTSPPDLISYSTQDPQFLTNSYKPEGEEMRWITRKMEETCKLNNHIPRQVATTVVILNKTTAATFSFLPAHLGVQIKQRQETWKTSDAHISPKGPSRTLQGRNKETEESNGYVLTFRNRELRIRTCKSKGNRQEEKSADSSSSFTKDPKMIFLPPFRNRDWRIITRTPNTNQTGGSEPRTTRKEREKKRKRLLGHQEQRGTQGLPAPNHRTKPGDHLTSKPTPEEFASRKRAKKKRERRTQERAGWMDGWILTASASWGRGRRRHHHHRRSRLARSAPLHAPLAVSRWFRRLPPFLFLFSFFFPLSL